MFKFFQRLFKKDKNTKAYRLGDVFEYRGSCLIVVDIRKSRAMGTEYIVYLDGQTHGWLTHSILKQLEDRREK